MSTSKLDDDVQEGLKTQTESLLVSVRVLVKYGVVVHCCKQMLLERYNLYTCHTLYWHRNTASQQKTIKCLLETLDNKYIAFVSKITT